MSLLQLSEKIQKRCSEKKCTLSLAESITGGALAAALVALPGASAFFMGSIVAYSKKAKQDFLEVPSACLEAYGEVSCETALAMALGAQKKFPTDISLAVTGIAGPSGATATKPVGRVAFAYCIHATSRSWSCDFQGNRASIIEQTVLHALEVLYAAL